MKKNNILKISCLLLGASIITELSGQVKIGNNATSIDPSAVLELEKTNQGLLITRIALTGATDNSTISSPANSLLIYNTATAGSGGDAVAPVFYFWGHNNLCSMTLDSMMLPDMNTTDGSTVQLLTFSDTSRQFESGLYRIIGCVHLDWPGPGSGANKDFNAGVEIWNFFNQYQLSEFTSVAEPGVDPHPYISVFPQPANPM